MKNSIKNHSESKEGNFNNNLSKHVNNHSLQTTLENTSEAITNVVNKPVRHRENLESPWPNKESYPLEKSKYNYWNKKAALDLIEEGNLEILIWNLDKFFELDHEVSHALHWALLSFFSNRGHETDKLPLLKNKAFLLKLFETKAFWEEGTGYIIIYSIRLIMVKHQDFWNKGHLC